MRKLLSLLVLFTLWACQSESQDPLKQLILKTPQGEAIQTKLVYTAKDMQQGLSGVKPEDFDDDQGMLFFYLTEEEKHFWMPDTYMDLDIFYLDKELKILDVNRKVPHYVGWANPSLIPRARPVWARHVLEMKASSSLAAKLKIGDQLKWESKLSLEETENQIKKQLSL
jgi:uncharacterized membrane protein (UPF0127 family)